MSMPYGLKVSIGARRLHQHRVIAERALGKALPSRAQVHHVDGDQSNNANTNLVICESIAYHRLLHVRTRIVKRGGNPNLQRICCICDALLPLDAFYPRSERPSGIRSECKQCCAEIYQAKRATA